MNPKTIFFLGMIVAGSGVVSPPVALLGVVYGFSFTHPFHLESRNLSRFLLQAAVVALGFGMSLRQVVHAGKAGFLYTAVSITIAMILGWLLGRLLGVTKKASFLITAGTAICGGSAIAAIAPITKPDEEEMAMSLGTVFILNSVALLLFPAIGLAFHMTQTQFGRSLALVHSSLLRGGPCEYIRSTRRGCVSRAKPPWASRPHSRSLPDRYQLVEGHAAPRRRAAVYPGGLSVDHRCDRVVSGYPGGMDHTLEYPRLETISGILYAGHQPGVHK